MEQERPNKSATCQTFISGCGSLIFQLTTALTVSKNKLWQGGQVSYEEHFTWFQAHRGIVAA